MVHHHEDDNELPTENGLFETVGRRSYLKLAGITAAGAFLASQVAAAAPSGYTYAIVIDGRDSSAQTQYAFDVADQVMAVDSLDNTNDSISGTHVDGSVSGTVNGYWFSSQITDLSVDGPAAVTFGANTDQLIPEQTNTLVITSPSSVNYTFTTDGAITKRLDAGDLSAESANDTVTDNGDGTWTATGLTGNGYGDSYDIVGSVTSFSADTQDYSLQFNGKAVTVSDLTGSGTSGSGSGSTLDTLVLTSPSSLNYAFTADGEITKILDAGDLSAESANDTVTDNGDGTWTATGLTGNGYGDSYTLAGSVTDFTPMTGDYSLQLNGQAITAYDLTGQTAPSTGSGSSPTNGLLGGGDGYPNAVDPSQADFTAGSLSALRSALSSASSGDIVYLTADVSTTSTITVPRGVTLASDRGIGGSPGSQISTSSRSATLIDVERDARVTGIQIKGPLSPGYHAWTGYPAGRGINCQGSGIEIDNVDGRGFQYAAVRAANDEHVHHCNIHDNSQESLGYGVVCTGGHPVIEYCEFDWNRHSVAGSGSGGYTVRYNHFGPDTIDHVIDMHEPGGTNLMIHHNTVEATKEVPKSGGGPVEAVFIRERPSDICRIENNWFFHPNPPTPGGGVGEAIRTRYDSWQAANVFPSNNHYGTDEPASDIGAPR